MTTILKFLLIFIFLIPVCDLRAQFGLSLTGNRTDVEIPFEVQNNLIVIPVVLNNAIPLKFILDTGVRTAILTEKTISDLMEISYDRKLSIIGGGGGDTIDAYVAHNVTLHLPGVRGSGQPLLILEQDLLYRDYEKFDQAKGILDDALQSRPSNPDLLYNRGLLAAEMDLLEVHEQDMRTLIEIQPENAHAYNALGYTLADQTERFDEAFELITKALELAPDDPFILDSMGWVHYRKGNFEEAINYLRQALASKEDAEIAAHLGEVLWLSGSKEEAREIWKLGKEWGPENATLIETLERLTPDDSSI